MANQRLPTYNAWKLEATHLFSGGQRGRPAPKYEMDNGQNHVRPFAKGTLQILPASKLMGAVRLEGAQSPACCLSVITLTSIFLSTSSHLRAARCGSGSGEWLKSVATAGGGDNCALSAWLARVEHNGRMMDN